MKKITIPKSRLKKWLSKGYSAGQISNIEVLSRPTVTSIVKRDHPELLKKLQENGKANHGGARRN